MQGNAQKYKTNQKNARQDDAMQSKTTWTIHLLIRAILCFCNISFIEDYLISVTLSHLLQENET